MSRQSIPSSLFGRRLRDARNRLGVAQDKLGVMIGIDEESSSARISRYETGTHEPPFAIAEKLAFALGVPTVFFYCADDKLADFLLQFHELRNDQQNQLFELATDLSRLNNS